MVARRGRQNSNQGLRVPLGGLLGVDELVGLTLDADAVADIAWVRFENYDPSTAVAEKPTSPCENLTRARGRRGIGVLGASLKLPADFLRMLAPPQVEVPA
jgi:hypothetical protein